MTTLHQDLTILAGALGAPPQALIDFAAEDSIGGFHPDPAKRTFPVGSLWGVEGKTLYALCRWLKPEHVVEVGTFRGASAVHILTALERNQNGKLTTIDVNPSMGDLIPENLRHRLHRSPGWGNEQLAKLVEAGEEAQLVFEDTSHGADDTERIVGGARALHPKIILSHDAMHPTEGAPVREGWRRVFGDAFKTMISEPSDCGFAYKVL